MGKEAGHLPTEAVVAVNLECNARCRMCEIWQLKEKGSLAADDYKLLPGSLERVNITGGEPTMRSDLAAIVRNVHTAANGPQIVVTTNGYLTGRILGLLDDTDDLRPRIGLGISLDGIGATHDRIRGTRNAFAKVMRTIDALRSRGTRNIRISFTISNENVDELPAVYELSRSRGIEFCMQLVHNSALYYHTDRNKPVDSSRLRASIARINHRELAKLRPKPWFRAYFNHGIVEHNDFGKRLVPCDALEDFFYLSPHGDVHPCLFISDCVGNIKERAFESIWRSAHRAATRTKIAACEDCWLMCSARTGLRRQPLGALAWVAKRQGLRLLGRYGSA
jgi:MoaA/NifB/PqqE/SkfB family radical SAM enzyme